ncbi:hypothetical protein TNCV_2932001 [Trichonephila clavipes]|nr:hypothetical protein TNCV_2932001 [Trichonephila clavipes]
MGQYDDDECTLLMCVHHDAVKHVSDHPDAIDSPEMHPEPTFCVLTVANAVVREYYSRSGLSSKIIGTLKIRFRILTPHAETHTELTFNLQSLEELKIWTRDWNAKPFYPISAISIKIRAVSEI